MTLRRWLPIAVGILVTLALVATARSPAAGAGWRVAFVGIHLASFAVLWRYLKHTTLDARTLWIGAVVFRLCALPLSPTLSDDGYRYLWDGRVTVEARTSPYAYQPSDPVFSTWRETVEYERMNSRAYYSVYPPVSQVAFALAASVRGALGWRGAWWLWKVGLVVAELVAIAFLLRIASASAAALYAWSPLAVIEIAGQGHTEALLLLGLAAVVGARAGRVPWRSLGAVFAGGVKLYPLAMLPLAWRREGWRGVGASVLALVVLSVPLWSGSARQHIGESLALFLGTFDEYSAPYRLLKAVLYPIAGDHAGRWASGALSLAFACVAAGVWAVDDGTRQFLVRGTTALVIGVVLTTTTLHPWYGLPVLYVLPLLDHKKPLAWGIAWASAGYLGYGIPHASLWVLGIGWGGGAWLAWTTHRATATARPPSVHHPPSSSGHPSRSRRNIGGTT